MTTRVLVVDDEPGILAICRGGLRGDGYEVATASSGDEAAARLGEGWDVVLTDIGLPGKISGLDLMKTARASTGAEILVMTGLPQLETAVAALRGQAQDYLVKPFSVAELRSAVDRCANARRGAEKALDRLVTPEVTRFMRAHSEAAGARGERRQVTVFFADVRQFTPFAAAVPPEDAMAALNGILRRVIEAVHAHGGILNKFIGDGILAVFGAPVPNAEHAAAAARAALQARDEVEKLCAARLRWGLPPLRIGIGINTGEVVAGFIGTERRAEYSVIGHEVNVASRLEGASGPGQILLGPATAAALGSGFELADLGGMEFAGIEGRLRVSELRGLSPVSPASS